MQCWRRRNLSFLGVMFPIPLPVPRRLSICLCSGTFAGADRTVLTSLERQHDTSRPAESVRRYPAVGCEFVPESLATAHAAAERHVTHFVHIQADCFSRQVSAPWAERGGRTCRLLVMAGAM